MSRGGGIGAISHRPTPRDVHVLPAVSNTPAACPGASLTGSARSSSASLGTLVMRGPTRCTVGCTVRVPPPGSPSVPLWDKRFLRRCRDSCGTLGTRVATAAPCTCKGSQRAAVCDRPSALPAEQALSMLDDAHLVEHRPQWELGLLPAELPGAAVDATSRLPEPRSIRAPARGGAVSKKDRAGPLAGCRAA